LLSPRSGWASSPNRSRSTSRPASTPVSTFGSSATNSAGSAPATGRGPVPSGWLSVRANLLSCVACRFRVPSLLRALPVPSLRLPGAKRGRVPPPRAPRAHPGRGEAAGGAAVSRSTPVCLAPSSTTPVSSARSARVSIGRVCRRRTASSWRRTRISNSFERRGHARITRARTGSGRRDTPTTQSMQPSLDHDKSSGT
jgi:hypothetical protein